jgi:hypothetical protein
MIFGMWVHDLKVACTISKVINIKPKELQEKQFAKYKNYKKSKIDKTKTKTNDKKCKNKPKRIQ